MRRIIPILLAGLLLFSLAACNKGAPEEKNMVESEEQTSTNEAEKEEESSPETKSEKKVEIPPAPASEDEPKLFTEEEENEGKPSTPNEVVKELTPGASTETTTPPEAAVPKQAPSPETPTTPTPASPETPFPEITNPPETTSPNQEATSAMTIGYAGTMDDGKTKVYIAMDDAVETMAIVFLNADNTLNVSLIGEVTESAERQCLVVTDEAQQVSLDFAPTFNSDRTVTMDFGTMGSATISPMDVNEVLAIISKSVSSTKSAIS